MLSENGWDGHFVVQTFFLMDLLRTVKLMIYNVHIVHTMWVSQQLKLNLGLFGLEIVTLASDISTIRFVTVCKVEVVTCFLFISLSHTRLNILQIHRNYTMTTKHTQRQINGAGIISMLFKIYDVKSGSVVMCSPFLRMNWISQTRTGKPCLLCLPRRNGKSIAARRRWVLHNIINNLRFSLAVC